jgi:hypothetical protein
LELKGAIFLLPSVSNLSEGVSCGNTAASGLARHAVISSSIDRPLDIVESAPAFTSSASLNQSGNLF